MCADFRMCIRRFGCECSFAIGARSFECRRAVSNVSIVSVSTRSLVSERTGSDVSAQF